jgi:hypothetical protein
MKMFAKSGTLHPQPMTENDVPSLLEQTKAFELLVWFMADDDLEPFSPSQIAEDLVRNLCIMKDQTIMNMKLY